MTRFRLLVVVCRFSCAASAVIESFAILKNQECFTLGLIHSIAGLQAKIEEYLVYYNPKRIKLAFKGLSPVQYRISIFKLTNLSNFWGRSKTINFIIRI